MFVAHFQNSSTKLCDPNTRVPCCLQAPQSVQLESCQGSAGSTEKPSRHDLCPRPLQSYINQEETEEMQISLPFPVALEIRLDRFLTDKLKRVGTLVTLSGFDVANVKYSWLCMEKLDLM